MYDELTSAMFATTVVDQCVDDHALVAEISEAAPGGSSAMPHKRNPAGATLIIAATHQIPGVAANVIGGLAVDEQRSAGPWQAELPAVRALLRLLGGAAAQSRDLVAGLTVDVHRMRANLSAAKATASDEMLASARLIDRALAAHQRALR